MRSYPCSSFLQNEPRHLIQSNTSSHFTESLVGCSKSEEVNRLLKSKENRDRLFYSLFHCINWIRVVFFFFRTRRTCSVYSRTIQVDVRIPAFCVAIDSLSRKEFLRMTDSIIFPIPSLQTISFRNIHSF